MSDQSPLWIRARNLSGVRGGRTLFTGFDLELAPGMLLWLRGSNGAGKTSLLRLLSGLAPPAAGLIQRRALIYIGHLNALAGDLTLVENLTFFAALEGRGRGRVCEDVAMAALDAFGLTPQGHLPVRRLSQGQQRRGALARLALDASPRAWLLDEPHDALDADGTSRLNAMLIANAARGGAVLLTSHQSLTLPGLASLDLDDCAVA